MSKATTRKFSANENEIDELLRENSQWKVNMSHASEEITFLNHFLNADIFRKNKPDLEENLESFLTRLENFKSDSLELTMEIHNHRYDIEGMMECEDIGCERFYHEEHVKLDSRIRNFLESFKAFKLELFSYSGSLLKKKKKTA